MSEVRPRSLYAPDKGAHTAADLSRSRCLRTRTQSYRTLVTVNYFVFFYALRLIPLLGAPLSFFYASVVDAYYCFECAAPSSPPAFSHALALLASPH